MGDLLTGYLGALVAVVFFGSCYVPAKQYTTYDGIIFQWFMCSGILLVGLLWGLLSNNWVQYSEAGLFAFPQGILGGSFFAIANLLIPTVVNTLGLGLGFMLWNATNITLGYAISRFGLLGVSPTVPAHPELSALGIAFMIASIGVYGMIKPSLVDPSLASAKNKSTNKSETSQLLSPPNTMAAHHNSYHSSMVQDATHQDSPGVLPIVSHARTLSLEDESLSEALLHPELPNFGPFMMAADVSDHVALVDRSAERKRRVIGMLLALVVGAFLSCCLVPFTNWQQSCHPFAMPEEIVRTCNPLNFVFAQCLGIYLTSTVVFLGYSLVHRLVLRRSMPRSVMRPAYMCGVLWAIGLMGQLLSMGKLGFDQAYPLSSIGPAMVSMLWSACYFHEIQGARNQIVLAVATVMVCIGTGLRVISQ